jgi:hypothetical protein
MDEMEGDRAHLGRAARAILEDSQSPLSLEYIASEMFKANGHEPPLGLEYVDFCTVLLSILEESPAEQFQFFR